MGSWATLTASIQVNLAPMMEVDPYANKYSYMDITIYQNRVNKFINDEFQSYCGGLDDSCTCSWNMEDLNIFAKIDYDNYDRLITYPARCSLIILAHARSETKESFRDWFHNLLNNLKGQGLDIDYDNRRTSWTLYDDYSDELYLNHNGYEYTVDISSSPKKSLNPNWDISNESE